MTDKLKMHISNASPLVHILYVHNSLYPMQSHHHTRSNAIVPWRSRCAIAFDGGVGGRVPPQKKEK